MTAMSISDKHLKSYLDPLRLEDVGGSQLVRFARWLSIALLSFIGMIELKFLGYLLYLLLR